MERQQSGIARFRTLTESAHGGVIGSDEEGSVRYCSAHAAALFGYSASDILGGKVADLIVAEGLHDGDDGDSARHLKAVGQRADGSAFPLDLTVVSIRAGATSLLLWVLRERTGGDVDLEDPLTLLPNRRFCVQRVRERLEHASINQGGFALFVVALDGIDDLNRRAGRAAGDAALVEAASRLRQAVPSADLIGRFGGAEFCVVASDMAAPTELETLARSIVDALAFPIEAGGESFQATPNVGIALAPADATSADGMFDAALTALDRAKHDVATVCFYGAEITNRLEQRRELQDALRMALETDQFTLDFLPLIDLGTGEVAGAEALLRWVHPKRGPIAPLDFIPLAEESGLMIPIGTWVIREALRCARRWNEGSRKLRVAVNVTARHLNTPGFIRQLSASIAASGCRPDWLELELTESIAMANAATVQLILAEIRAAGVRTALDDFGTGYSSMAYLKSIPVDVIKIDRSFVDGIPHDNSDSSIVRAIVAFALCTGREVRAEGVTSIEQARWLHAEGCDAAQGFFFSKPIPAADFDAWLAAYEAESPVDQT
jgi:diguanylate cyclase (GGDEF)-like protein/PAS domain S-box-containing protein